MSFPTVIDLLEAAAWLPASPPKNEEENSSVEQQWGTFTFSNGRTKRFLFIKNKQTGEWFAQGRDGLAYTFRADLIILDDSTVIKNHKGKS